MDYTLGIHFFKKNDEIRVERQKEGTKLTRFLITRENPPEKYEHVTYRIALSIRPEDFFNGAWMERVDNGIYIIKGGFLLDRRHPSFRHLKKQNFRWGPYLARGKLKKERLLNGGTRNSWSPLPTPKSKRLKRLG